MATAEENPPFYTPSSSAATQQEKLSTASSGKARPTAASSLAAASKETADSRSRSTTVLNSPASFSCASAAHAPGAIAVSSSFFRSSFPLSRSSSAIASAFSSPLASTVTSTPSLAAEVTASGSVAVPSPSAPAALSGFVSAVDASPSSAGAAAPSVFPAAAPTASADPLRYPPSGAAASPVAACSAAFATRLPLSRTAVRDSFSAAGIQALPSTTNCPLLSSSVERSSAEDYGRPATATQVNVCIDVPEATTYNGGSEISSCVTLRCPHAGEASPAGVATTEATAEPLKNNEDEREQQEQNSNLYEVLGVTPQASANDIRRVYYALCRVYHPDKCTSASSVCAAKLHALQQAYSVLGDEAKRLVYDIRLGFYSGAEKRKRVAQVYRLQRERTRRDIENMRAEYKRKVQQERRVNGLLIRKAWYGNLGLRRSLRAQNYVGPVAETCLEGPFLDVTVPLQCQVDNSRFVFPGGADCSLDQLKGFHNPALCTSDEDSVCLYVLYDFQGLIHEATATHQSPLAMPLKRHRVSLALGPLGPYAPSNVTSLCWRGQGILYPVRHTARKVPAREIQCIAKDCMAFASNERRGAAVEYSGHGATLSKSLHASATGMGETSSHVVPVYLWSLGECPAATALRSLLELVTEGIFCPRKRPQRSVVHNRV